jgi:AAA family ATP:ADP antiporter
MAGARQILTPEQAPVEPEARVSSSRLLQLVRRGADVKPDELRAVLLGAAYFFFLFCSYFILRPIRDAWAVATGVTKLPWLFAGTLSAMLVANPLFSALVVRFPVRRFIGITYQFFALNLIAFYLLGRALEGQAQIWLGSVFFVWTSVFNLFVLSVFWSFMVDHFNSEQAKRVFGFIGVGGTLGSIVGSALTSILARKIGPTNLLLVSVALLEVAVLIVAIFPRRPHPQSRAEPSSHYSAPIGGRVWTGLVRVVQSQYLLGIAVFLVLYTLGSTVLYFEQTDVVGRYFKTAGARTEVLARIELAAQTLTVLTQAFLTGRIVRWIGLAATLAIMPAVSAIGFTLVGASAVGVLPLLGTFVIFTVLRRATNFALNNPGTEVLFTVVSREDKFKAKSFIETFVYRAGDQVAAWTYGGLTALGLGLAGIAWATAPASLVLLALGVWLGRKHDRLAFLSRATSSEPQRPSNDLTSLRALE